MVFIQEFKPGKFYLVKKVRTEKGRRNRIIRRATDEEARIYRESRQKGEDAVTTPCSNCGGPVMLTRAQMHKLTATYFKRYRRINLIYCSTACQEEHNRALGIAQEAKHVNSRD